MILGNRGIAMNHVRESKMKWPVAAFQQRERGLSADPFLGCLGFGPLLLMESEEYGKETGVVISNYANVALLWSVNRRRFEVVEISKAQFADGSGTESFCEW